MQGVFTPEYKWGPLSFMRLTHEAFRGAMPRLVKAAQAAAQGGQAAHHLGVGNAHGTYTRPPATRAATLGTLSLWSLCRPPS
jgi:hypothetical protein